MTKPDGMTSPPAADVQGNGQGNVQGNVQGNGQVGVPRTMPKELAAKLACLTIERHRNGRRRRLVRATIAVVVVLALWHVMAVFYDLQLLLPTPLTVIGNVFNTLTLNYSQRWLYGPNIYEHLASSLAHALTGFCLAAALAIPLGILVGWSQTVREYVDPVVRAFFPIPGIAWIPLAILWFGLGDVAVIFVVVVAEFFPLYFNTEAGVRRIDPLILDAARCYGARGLTLLRRVVLPASIPNIITGMRIGLGGAWRMIVAAEMLASQAGIGSVLTEARYQFRAADLMMAMILISIIGYITERIIVGSLERRTIQRWDAIPAR